MLNFNQQKIIEHQFHSLTLFHINQNEGIKLIRKATNLHFKPQHTVRK